MLCLLIKPPQKHQSSICLNTYAVYLHYSVHLKRNIHPNTQTNFFFFFSNLEKKRFIRNQMQETEELADDEIFFWKNKTL